MRTFPKQLLVLCLLVASGCGDGASPPDESAGITRARIVNGQPDDGAYPQVGTLVRRVPLPDGPFAARCSGTLLAEDVFLTAAHCIVAFRNAGVQDGQYGVSFDPVFVPGVSKVITGVAHVHPDFSLETLLSDVAVVVLDEPVVGVRPSKLIAGVGRLEKIGAERLATEEIVDVGYGMDGSGTAASRGTRRVATQRFLSFERTIPEGTPVDVPYANWVALGGPYEEGNGVSFNGDSGGPHFLDGRIIAVTSTGDPASPTALEWAQRVDVKPVRQFIMSFLDD